MANHFLLSAAARTLKDRHPDDMSEEEAYRAFLAVRFAANEGNPACPHCGCVAAYAYKTRRIFKCKSESCGRQFSATTGTAFADRKLAFRKILRGVAAFVEPSKGFNAIEMTTRLRTTYKTAFKLAQKLRIAIAEMDTDVVFKGEVEIDGCEIGGFIRPPNVKKTKTDHRKWPHRSNRKEHLVVIRERAGRIRTTVTKCEADAKDFLLHHTDRKAVVYADSAPAWNTIHLKRKTKRINHKVAYVTPEANTNSAESFFSIVRRSEHGVYHHISGVHLRLYGAELAWRQQNNRVSDGQRYDELLAGLMKKLPRAPKHNRALKSRRQSAAEIVTDAN